MMIKPNVCYFGTENTLKNYKQFQHIMIGTSNIKIVPVVRNLGVYNHWFPTLGSRPK